MKNVRKLFLSAVLLFGMFFTFSIGGVLKSVTGAFILLGIILLGVLMTFLSSKLLSKSVLSGEPSSFTLELPDKDYGGAEFNILCTLEIAQFFDEESAHIQGLKSAVTSRNSKAESLYNVDIKYTLESGNAGNADKFASTVRTACMIRQK